jgi:hypothetical protein
MLDLDKAFEASLRARAEGAVFVKDADRGSRNLLGRAVVALLRSQVRWVVGGGWWGVGCGVWCVVLCVACRVYVHEKCGVWGACMQCQYGLYSVECGVEQGSMKCTTYK